MGEVEIKFSNVPWATESRAMKVRWRVRTLLVIIAIMTGALALDLRKCREIQPYDLIDVEVQSALPGRPITAERFVRPDGEITLGYYGDVYVAGLTPRVAKAKIVDHLRRYLSAESLGLVECVTRADGTRSIR
jgi:protein involved in polysaccharide export with SLBB domain